MLYICYVAGGSALSDVFTPFVVRFLQAVFYVSLLLYRLYALLSLRFSFIPATSTRRLLFHVFPVRLRAKNPLLLVLQLLMRRLLRSLRLRPLLRLLLKHPSTCTSPLACLACLYSSPVLVPLQNRPSQNPSCIMNPKSHPSSVTPRQPINPSTRPYYSLMSIRTNNDLDSCQSFLLPGFSTTSYTLHRHHAYMQLLVNPS
ncbi:hypothetical protein BDQ12DRAFT_503843 [Crucibulum laeve]|uniref:Uncharacterized protein n=1 Tax=Crucibulum laeve TaxID=68775 RepID=A0A5C3LI72_9AGAR|nr:hypothetical protein BDQ12DRAFT_503843 [Crucibulum laeve]